MYYPYFRGKQNELITIRDNAQLLAASNFIPIIEPVKSTLSGLNRALLAVETEGGEAIVIVNPQHGDLSRDSDTISDLLTTNFNERENILAGVLLSKDISVDQVMALYDRHKGKQVTFVHAGFSDGGELSNRLGTDVGEIRHVFVENYCGKLYRRKFKSDNRVLIQDGFEKRKNREYPPVEFFSDLHITYDEEGVNGFGDFLIAGDDYNESGGPAYAVAIHLTFIDPNKDDEMHIHHFISDRMDTPTDPAGKFAEALAKLVVEVGKEDSKIADTAAVQEYLDLHQRGHFPGLGYVKKLSMQHHLETLSQFLAG